MVRMTVFERRMDVPMDVNMAKFLNLIQGMLEH